MANRVLGGRYAVQDKIGTGGMAIVYRGLDEVLGRPVAIKTMLPQYANDQSFAARFKQEAQAAAALAGCFDKERDPAQPARPGLLLGTRRLELHTDSFAAGRTYRVTAASTFWDAETAAFACTVVDDAGTVVAEAALNAFRPPDFGTFIKEQAET